MRIRDASKPGRARQLHALLRGVVRPGAQPVHADPLVARLHLPPLAVLQPAADAEHRPLRELEVDQVHGQQGQAEGVLGLPGARAAVQDREPQGHPDPSGVADCPLDELPSRPHSKRGRWIREKLLAGRVPDVPITVDARVPETRTRPSASGRGGDCGRTSAGSATST